MVELITNCRCCMGKRLEPVHDFGYIPIADQLTIEADFVKELPLSTVFCLDCYHFQIGENLPPEIMFQNNYPYFSSGIPEVVEHFKRTYRSIVNKVNITSEDLVLEIASNDGVLISQFQGVTNKLWGVEPSPEHAEITENKGIRTNNNFFNIELADRLIQELPQQPKLIMACNVLAHVPHPISFVKGLEKLSNNDTVIVIELAHALPMFENGTFDVIFHQHFSYFNLSTLKLLLETNGLYINDVEVIETQGGSVRLFASKIKWEAASVEKILDKERLGGLYHLDLYRVFSKKIKRLRDETITLLREIKSKGKCVIGYGAPGKAANYLNYFGINVQLFDCLIDISPSKHYKFFPNTGLKVYPLEYLEEKKIDYIFILVWNYLDSILEELSYLRDNNVQFIVGFPELKIL